MKTLPNHPFPQFARNLAPPPSCVAVKVDAGKKCQGNCRLFTAPVRSLGPALVTNNRVGVPLARNGRFVSHGNAEVCRRGGRGRVFQRLIAQSAATNAGY